jgi:hypothetical protein
MSIIDKAKFLLGLFALCLLSSLMQEKAPPKYVKGTYFVSAEYKAWEKRQQRNEL